MTAITISAHLSKTNFARQYRLETNSGSGPFWAWSGRVDAEASANNCDAARKPSRSQPSLTSTDPAFSGSGLTNSSTPGVLA